MTTENEKPEVVHNYWISFLCVLFGLGTWLPVNAVYSQLPIFVQFAPEGWNLPSYISLLIQCANIAPLLWYFFHDKFIRKQSIIICFFLSLGTVSLFCLAFTYRIQYLILGTMHSIYFFLFTFCVALVGCVSSVLFLPFMNKLPELYLVPYFIGEGLSGLIPSVIALVQGVGRDQKCVNITTPTGVKLEKVAEEPYFGSTLFLVISGCFMLLSTLSFFYLNYVSNFIQPPTSVSDFIQLPVDSSESPKQQRSNSVTSITPINLTKTLFAVLLLAQTLINCFSNGILPSIQSYSCLPYGREAYHWSVNLNQIINPIIIYSAFYLPVISLRVLAACGAVQIMCLVYELLTAFTSPVPPLVGTTVGVVFIVSKLVYIRIFDFKMLNFSISGQKKLFNALTAW